MTATVVATLTALCCVPSYAQNCSNIDATKPINPILACLKELSQQNETLRNQIGELIAKAAVPGPQGEPGAKGDPGERGESGPPGIGSEIPTGVVVAFEGNCPELGWSVYAPATARFIIGAGDVFDPKHRKWKRMRPDGGFDEMELTVREFRSSDGEEAHILQEPEMPTHNHLVVANVGQPPNGDALTANNSIKREDWSSGHDPAYHLKGLPNPPNAGASSSSGGSQPSNNMPPYVALNYCRKN